ncbi:DUF2911 domain-containing protein [Fulvivirga lutimaris]|uniref:DUF2911 domain-containing protein n=1 Tax=Fulvivirga lutimaris TaxID=1819566 RepID=UPI0012BC360D|nr:DUF2911 domain-containing protein [Fulvivirga lutimaris]MTI41935.1 DUF2911 domain-containing protein [Fulvivirga lutimaris]
MKKIIVIAGIAVAVIAVSMVGFRMYTKSFSPQDKVDYAEGNIDISVSYGRPFKKDRVVFGGLVPYDKVWRTGANEPTIFTTNVDLRIGDQVLPKGDYALFTVPGRESWQIIFNRTIPGWGVDFFSGEAANDSATQELVAEVAPINTKNMFEQFTIAFEEMHDEVDMVLMWDQTLVVVPMIPQN